MKIEIELNERGFAKVFKIDGKDYGKGIEKVNIIIDANNENTKMDIYTHSKVFPQEDLEELVKKEKIYIYNKHCKSYSLEDLEKLVK